MTPEKPPYPKHVIDSDQELLAVGKPQAELLRWYYRLIHLTFSKINILAMLGIIPNILSNAEPQKCKGLINRSMTNRPWRTKVRQENAIKTVTKLGQCISVDQL